MAKICINLAVLILLICCPTEYAYTGWSIDIESGLVYSGYNDVRIPGDSGSDLSLSEELDADGTGFVRLRLIRDFNRRHRLSLLVAPLRIRSSGTVDRDIDFNSVRFPAGTTLKSNYRFDSYRLTYHYTLLDKDRLRAGMGFTAKIRDASIRIEASGSHSEKANTGLVPLVNFAIDWRPASRLGLIFEGDALAAPQGRAEDVLLAIYSEPVDNLRIRLGYRILEGGADNDEVYTFALLHYIVAGATWSF